MLCIPHTYRIPKTKFWDQRFQLSKVHTFILSTTGSNSHSSNPKRHPSLKLSKCSVFPDKGRCRFNVARIKNNVQMYVPNLHTARNAYSKKRKTNLHTVREMAIKKRNKNTCTEQTLNFTNTKQFFLKLVSGMSVKPESLKDMAHRKCHLKRFRQVQSNYRQHLQSFAIDQQISSHFENIFQKLLYFQISFQKNSLHMVEF